jgi:ubiquitin carboxyl-terminal hydrolase 7
MPNLVATHRYNADEGDWGFTRFFELRKLFHTEWDGQGVPLVQNDEANITAYVRIVKDPTGVLWHSFQKYRLYHVACFMLLTGI